MSFIYPGGDAQVTPNLGLATWGMDEVLAENMILIDAAVTGGSGTVTSVSMTGDGVIFSSVVPGSPITTAGTLSPALLTHAANLVLAGPTTGVAATPTFRALVAADLPAGTGTVTSVGMTGDGVIFNSSVTGSPITTSGTLTPTLLTQTANRFLAGPTTGSAATPTFRALVTADLPAGVGTVTSVAMTGDGVIFNSTVSGSPITASGTLIPALLTHTANTVFAGPTTGSAATPTFRALVTADLPAGTGTVTSVAMTGDGVIFNATVSGSPVTTSGTLIPALLTHTANTVLAGPTSGGAAAPTFRALVATDIPATAAVATFSTTGLGYFTSMPAGWPYSSATNLATSASANRVYAVQIILPFVFTVSKISVQSGSTAGGVVCDFGVYNSGGTLLVNTGGINVNATSTVFSATPTPVTLNPGVYWVAWTQNGTTVTFNGLQDSNFGSGLLAAQIPSVMVHGANSATAGVLPGTLGALTTDAASTNIPLIIFRP